MLVLATYMDRGGFAYPGQPTWARAARKTVRTIQRYIARAKRDGWLEVVNAGRSGRGWAFNGYRCCVPDAVLLPEQDEEIATAIVAEYGDVEADDIAVSSATPNGHDITVSAPLAESSRNVTEGDDIRDTKVPTFGAEGADISPEKVPTSGCRTNSRSENSRSRTHAQDEGLLAQAVLPDKRFTGNEDQEPRLGKIRKAIQGLPGADDEAIRVMVRGATLEEVRRVRASP